MIKLFYLLYQLKDSNINWIVDIDIEINKNFIESINHISNEENYKIYSRYISTLWYNEEFGYKKIRFEIFTIENNDKFLYKSVLE
tara:strand:- start:3420 stop:3674 length:255 start_codon:yes stop_codon:yes gene_type:complete